jgi:AraC-like DNA-binding protein
MRIVSPVSSAPQVEVIPSELWLFRGAAAEMINAHQHDDIELNVVLGGAIDYLFGGQTVRVQHGQAAVFWASVPHRLLDIPGEHAEVCWAHVPLSTVLAWELPSSDLTQLLQGGLALAPAPVGAVPAWDSWADDLADDDPITALLEIQAMIRRILRTSRVEPSGIATTARPFRMAAHLMERFREPVAAADVAGAVHLNTEYAMTLFRRTWGMTIGEFLTRRRVAEAQRLLVTTELSTVAVAHSAGFGSVSNFYAQFAKHSGTSPGAYRATLRAGGRY